MYCPVCKNTTQVLDSRTTSEGQGVRRRRKCRNCTFRFSTFEEARILDMVIVKRDGHRQPYSREKLERGLQIALRKRAHTTESYERLVRDVELEIQSARNDEMTSKELGEIVMDKLRLFDKVAYIRFASVYRQFEDVETFADEIRQLNAKTET